MEEIFIAIENGDYERAEALLKAYPGGFVAYDASMAIADAAIGAYFGDRVRVWNAIRKGLEADSRNYELYVMLGEYHLSDNPYLSWLCYENALFYCDDPEDQKKIWGFACQLKEQYGIYVEKAAVIILSYNALKYTKLCIESIRATTPESAREIIVVDNASEDGSVEWLRKQKDILLVENKENRGFPAGCNQGIERSSARADIFLLNNDTILPENALFWLRMGLYDDEKNGMAGSVSNNAKDQIAEGVENTTDLLAFAEKTNVPREYSYEVKPVLVGFALLIRRRVLDVVGQLDEQFSPGNYEDNDYSLRVLKAGYRNILCKNSFILHFGSVSFKKAPDTLALLSRNRQKLNEKWGFDVEYYQYSRPELIALIEAVPETSLRILDVGCGGGALMGRIKGLYPKAEVYGIELVPEVAEIASLMGTVLCGDIEHMEILWDEEYFDYIIFGDILEHLVDPQNVLKRIKRYLKPGGHIIVSMPNLKHFSVLLPLLKWDVFPYGDSGILDRTHVKLYTGTEIRKLITRSGYVVEKMGSVMLVDQPDEEDQALIDILSGWMEDPDKGSFLAYQYLISARKL